MEPTSKTANILSTKKRPQSSRRECSDISEEYLDSVLEDSKTNKLMPPVCMYTVKSQESGLVAVDIKEFSDIAYATCYSSKVHVLSCNEHVTTVKKQMIKKRLIECDLESFKCPQKFAEVNVLQHPADVTALYYLNGHLLLSCCLNGTVNVWETNGNYQLAQSFTDVVKSISDIHASSRLDYFVVTSLTGLKCIQGKIHYGALLFSFSRNYPITSFIGHDAGTQSVRFHSNGMYVATTSQDNTIKLWSVHTSKPVRMFRDENLGSRQWRKIAFSPDGKYLASTCYGSVKIWDIASGKLLKTLGTVNPNHIVHNVCYSNSGEELVAGGTDGVLKVWNIKDFAVGSSDINSGIQLVEAHGANKPILNIRCTDNIFSCISHKVKKK